MQLYTGHGSHGGLYGLGVIDVGGAGRTEDVPDAEPVGNAHDGAQVARVLYIVQCQAERLADGFRGGRVVGLAEYGKDFLRRFQQAGTRQLVGAHFNDFIGGGLRVPRQPGGCGSQQPAVEMAQQVTHQLMAFGQERLFGFPYFLLFQ